jgi:serine/threonine-protein kinase
MRKDVLQRFFNEARTVAVVRNPHVVEVFDFGQEGKDLYLVMEFVDGLSLHGLLRQLRPDLGRRPGGGAFERRRDPRGRDPVVRFEPLEGTIAAALMCQAAEGLVIAAQHGVVHRDIKPENLMINGQGYLKISDFGIAHVQDDSITKTGAVLGSPLFMSPEQARGLKPITSQADMFSLGGVFYACLVGHPPFHGRTLTELFRKIATEPHVPLWRLRPDLDPALSGLVETLLRKDPGDRGGGPRWLHRQLKAYLMAAGIMDPADTVGGYVQELAARGIQTTWRMDDPDPRPPSALPDGTLPMHTVATERYTRESVRRKPSAALAAVLGALMLAAAGIGWGLLRDAGRSGRLRPLAKAPADGIPAVLASFKAIPPGAAPAKGAPSRAPGGASKPQDPGFPSSGSSPVRAEPLPRDSTAGRPDAAVPDSAGRVLVAGPSVPAPLAETVLFVLKSSPPFAKAFVDGN